MTLETSVVVVDARAQLQRIKDNWQSFWFELKDFYDHHRWIELGYDTFAACVESELRLSARRAFQLIDAAIVRESLSNEPGFVASDMNERQARELKVLPPAARVDVANVIDFATTSVRDLRNLVRSAQAQIAERQAERPPPPPKPSPSKLTDGVRLEVGNAQNIDLPTESVDLIVTSPPYGLEKQYESSDDDPADWLRFMESWLSEALRVSVVNGRLALNIPLSTTLGGLRPTYAQAVHLAVLAGWAYRSTIVWNEGNVSKSTARGSVDSASSPYVMAPVEMVALFSKGPWKRDSIFKSDLNHDEWLEWTNGLWTFGGESRPWEGHPAAFPEELPRRLIKLLSFPSDLICDPFLGSGTTAVEAYRLGRRFVGFDISREYVDSARRRIAREEDK